MLKNVANQVVSFQAVSATDGSAVTTGTPVVYYTVDGGVQASDGATPNSEGQGQWSYVPAQAETNGDHVAFTFVLSGCIAQTVNVYPITYPAGFLNATFPTIVASTTNITTLPDVTLADGVTHGGTSAVYQGKQISIVATDGATPAVTITGDSGPALQVEGSLGPAIVLQNVGVGTAISVIAASGTGLSLIGSFKDIESATIESILDDSNELQTNQGNWLTATGFLLDTEDGSSFTALPAVTLANGAHGGLASTFVLSDYSDFQGAAGGNVVVGSLTQAALAQFATDDTGETTAVDQSVAALSQGSGGSAGGSGSTLIKLTVRDSGGVPINNVDCWLTLTNDPEAQVSAGTLTTDGSGEVKFTVDTGIYYWWKQKGGVMFDNPEIVTVT